MEAVDTKDSTDCAMNGADDTAASNESSSVAKVK
jgi:hypothetical protein